MQTTYRGWTVPITFRGRSIDKAGRIRPTIINAINQHAALILRGTRPRRIKRAYARCQKRIKAGAL